MAGLSDHVTLRDITLTVTVYEPLPSRIRKWLFLRLLRLAVWVGGFGGVIVEESHTLSGVEDTGGVQDNPLDALRRPGLSRDEAVAIVKQLFGDDYGTDHDHA